MSARFYRHFNVIGCTQMQNSSMELIFATIFKNFVAKMAPEEGEDLGGMCLPLVQVPGPPLGTWRAQGAHARLLAFFIALFLALPCLALPPLPPHTLSACYPSFINGHVVSNPDSPLRKENTE